MEARHRDGCSHEIPVGVAEDVALACSNLCIIPKEPEFVTHLQKNHCSLMDGYITHHTLDPDSHVQANRRQNEWK